MPKMSKSELDAVATPFLERVEGDVLTFGEATVYVRPLTTQEFNIVVVRAGQAEDDLRAHVAQQMACRFGITGWDIQYTDGEALPYRRADMRGVKLDAVPLDLIEQLPIEGQIRIGERILELTMMSREESSAWILLCVGGKPTRANNLSAPGRGLCGNG